MRIVSLLPSATEIICELGLGGQLVGVSHECDYPAFVSELPRVTKALVPAGAASGDIDAFVRERLESERALYSLDVAVLARLRPDLIVTQSLCDVCAVATADVNAAMCKLPVKAKAVNLEATRLADVFHSFQVLGDAAGASKAASQVVERLQSRVLAVERRSSALATRPDAVLLEWIDPPFCSGHWSPELTRLAGGRELIGREGVPSRTTDWLEIVNADPDVLFIACCGFDAQRTRQDLPILTARDGFADMSCARSGRVYWVDGSAYFNRPGPRLVDSLEILANALHPDVHPLPAGLPGAFRL